MIMLLKDRIRTRRITLRMTQKELAARISVDPSSVRNYETGRSTPRASTLGRLEEVLGVSLRNPIALMTPHHLELKPDSISEEDWRLELKYIYESQVAHLKAFNEVAKVPGWDIEAEAAVAARHVQLWAHNLPTTFPFGPSYRLVTDPSGKQRWESNVRESPADSGVDKEKAGSDE